METGEPTAGGEVRAHLPVRRLVRRTDHRLLAGVAGGLADYTGLDPVIFRVMFVFLSFTGGAGLFLYVLGWLLIPKAGERFSPAERFVRRFRKTSWLGIALLIGAALVLAGEVGVWMPAPLGALALIVIGVVLLREDPPREADVTDTAVTRAPENFPPPAAAVDAPVARPRRPRSPLGYITIACTLLAVGGAAVLANLNALELAVGDYFALALVVLGAGLVVGAWWGRTRLMILLGILLLPAVLVMSLVHLPLQGEFGARYATPRSVAAVQRGYKLAAGKLEIDLSRVPFERGRTRVPVTMAVGELDILVPRRVHVYFSGTADAGELWAFGKTTEGVDLAIDRSFGSGSKKELWLDVRAGLGSVSVHWNDYYLGEPQPRPRKVRDRRGDRKRDRDGQGARSDRRQRDRDGKTFNEKDRRRPR